MHFLHTMKPSLLLCAALLSPCVQAHPGHEHSPGLAAGLVHSIAGWGPLPVLLLLVAAAGYALWQARGK